MKTDRFKTWELWLKTLTLIGLIIGAFWAFYTYTDTKEKEFYTQYWHTKLELFLETSGAASEMATTSSVDDFNKSRAKYWELYYGRLSLVEGEQVKGAMQAFSSNVPKEPIDPANDLPMKSLQQPAYRLTIALKKELGEAWRNPFSELP